MVVEVASVGEGLAATISGARSLRLRQWCGWRFVIPRRQQLAIRPSNLVSAHLVAIGALSCSRRGAVRKLFILCGLLAYQCEPGCLYSPDLGGFQWQLASRFNFITGGHRGISAQSLIGN